jgi:hypothetical protein
MATRWSHLHGELYLGRERLLDEVEDMEGLKAVLWLRGIRQRHLGLGGLLGGGRRSPPVAARLREGDSEEGMAREREGGVGLVFTVNTRARRGGTRGHARHAVAHP